jgi:ATP-dependent RNA helicase DDX54/DBP10
MAFFAIKHEEKVAALLFLLEEVIDPEQQTILFVATKHHVEFFRELLSSLKFSVSYVYGALDPTARKINVADFRNGRTKLLIVTDVAARGIDIPLLDNVINYDFPSVPKLFVHRVGRVARAGRLGYAYSLVTMDEVFPGFLGSLGAISQLRKFPYFIDLQLFLGRSLVICNEENTEHDSSSLVFGAIPQEVVDQRLERLKRMLGDSSSLVRYLELLILFRRLTRSCSPDG